MGSASLTTRLSGVLLTCIGAAALAVAQTSRVGEITFPNSGAPAAQVSFLAGLAQLHNFEYASAAEHFRKAQAADRGFAMAYWGEAMTYTHPVWMEQDRDAARSALNRLAPTPEERLAKAPTRREQDYLRAVEILEVQLKAVVRPGGDAAGASMIEALRGAAAAEERMPFEFGPPAIDKPAYELLGETLLAMKRPADARAAFEKALARTPGRTASLRGLMLAADRSGDARKAADIRTRLKGIWRLVDQIPADVR